MASNEQYAALEARIVASEKLAQRVRHSISLNSTKVTTN